MSIHDEIKARCKEGRLFLAEPVVLGTAVKRWLFVSSEINGLVLAPWKDQDEAERFSKLRNDFDAFIGGGVIAVARKPRKAKSAFMSQLEPPQHRTWDIRSRDPSPGIRVLGAFAEQDMFVALTWSWRRDLGEYGSRQWRDAIEQCKCEWRQLFYPCQPISDGKPISEDNVHDYLSANILLVGNS